MAEISIIKYNKNFKEDMINFLGLHWKSLQNQESIRELFEWKYEKNPYGKFPVNYLAADGKKIVGHVGFYLQKYKLRNHTYTFAIAADAHVHPEYRRRGIFSDIINYSTGDILKRGDIDLIIHVTYNNKSAPCVMKSGYYAIDTRKKMYLFSVLNLLKKYILSEKKLFPINTKSADLKIEITDKLRAQEISEFNGILTKDDKINNIRDTAFYKWRYSHPLEKYIIAYCKKNEDKLVGYIIFKKHSKKSYSIMEYGYTEQTYFKKLFKEVSKKLSISFLQTNTFSRPKTEISLLKSLGFKNQKQIAGGLLYALGYIQEDKLPGMLISPTSTKIKDDNFILDEIDIRDKENWSIFESDLIWF